MTFNLAQFEATINQLNSGLTELDGHLKRVPQVASNAAGRWYMTESMSQAVLSVGNTLVNLGSWLLEKLQELLVGVAAPVRFFFLASDWGDVRGYATTVAGDLNPTALNVDHYWKGRAADAYVASIKPQIDAATRIGVMADKAATALTWSAAAGLAFYLALAVILVKLIAAFITALVALGSVVFSWAGLALIIEEAGVDGAMILAAVSALLAVLGSQSIQMSNLHSEASDAAAFPNHHWPSATTDRYEDATVKDGDADWSIEA